MVKQQIEYNKKLDELTQERTLKVPEEEKARVWRPDELLLAPTDTAYDEEFEKKPSVGSVEKEAKQNVQLATSGTREENEEEDTVKEGTSDRDNRIMTAMAIVLGVSFFFGGEESISENTFSTLLAMGAFFGAIKMISHKTD